MDNSVAKGLSVSFFIAAALLVLFGVAANNTDAGVAKGQLGLAVVMGGAGIMLRTGTESARLVGLAASGLTTTYGAYEIITGGSYVPGTIVAIFAFARLLSAGAAFGQATTYPAPAPYAAPLACGEEVAAPPQPVAGPTNPPTWSPTPAPAPASTAAPFGFFGQPGPAIPTDPTPGTDSRFG